MDNDSWNDLMGLYDEWDKLVAKEKLILEKWKKAENLDERRKLEEEGKNLPFKELNMRLLEARNKCFY